MHGWLYLKPRTTTPPLYDIIYGNMIAAGLEFDRYRTIARVSPLPTILRGYLVLSPRITNATPLVTRTRTVSVSRTSTTISGTPAQSYGFISISDTNTNGTRVDRDEGIAFAADPFLIATGIPRTVPNEIGMVKL